MILLTMILACGTNKTIETETVTTGAPVTTETATSTSTDKTIGTPTLISASKTVTGNTGTASTRATVTFVKPDETTTETDENLVDDPVTEETDD